MADNADDRRFSEPWHPMADPVDIKHLGKLLEELGEAVSAAARCLIQGVDEQEPTTGKSNRTWLEDELADVAAGSSLAKDRFRLNAARMLVRTAGKMKKLKNWHKQA